MPRPRNSKKHAVIPVELFASDFVRLEADAAKEKNSVERHASFLLSKWVLSTRKGGEAMAQGGRKMS